MGAGWGGGLRLQPQGAQPNLSCRWGPAPLHFLSAWFFGSHPVPGPCASPLSSQTSLVGPALLCPGSGGNRGSEMCRGVPSSAGGPTTRAAGSEPKAPRPRGLSEAFRGLGAVALRVQAPGLPPPWRGPRGGTGPSQTGPAASAPAGARCALSPAAAPHVRTAGPPRPLVRKNSGTGARGVRRCVLGPALVGGGERASRLASPVLAWPSRVRDREARSRPGR